MNNRELFWSARFTEKSHDKDVACQPDSMKIKLSKNYANECLVEYDRTFTKENKNDRN